MRIKVAGMKVPASLQRRECASPVGEKRLAKLRGIDRKKGLHGLAGELFRESFPLLCRARDLPGEASQALVPMTQGSKSLDWGAGINGRPKQGLAI